MKDIEMAEFAAEKQTDFLVSKSIDNPHLRNHFVNDILMSFTNKTLGEVINDALISCKDNLDIHELIVSLLYVENLCKQDTSLGYSSDILHNFYDMVCKKMNENRS